MIYAEIIVGLVACIGIFMLAERHKALIVSSEIKMKKIADHLEDILKDVK